MTAPGEHDARQPQGHGQQRRSQRAEDDDQNDQNQWESRGSLATLGVALGEFVHNRDLHWTTDEAYGHRPLLVALSGFCFLKDRGGVIDSLAHGGVHFDWQDRSLPSMREAFHASLS